MLVNPSDIVAGIGIKNKWFINELKVQWEIKICETFDCWLNQYQPTKKKLCWQDLEFDSWDWPMNIISLEKRSWNFLCVAILCDCLRLYEICLELYLSFLVVSTLLGSGNLKEKLKKMVFIKERLPKLTLDLHQRGRTATKSWSAYLLDIAG